MNKILKTALNKMCFGQSSCLLYKVTRRIVLRTYSVNAKNQKLNQYRKEGTIYYHWPFCKNICVYCSFNKYATSNKRFSDTFLSRFSTSLIKETESLIKISGVVHVNSIYFGGGTPSLAPLNTLSDLIQIVKKQTRVKENAEISIECNPSSNVNYHLEKYAEIGINRVSIGLQALDDKVLQLLGRDHSAKDALVLLDKAQLIFGKNNVNIDLLFRKPGDSVKSWLTELDKLLKFEPRHVSLYELTPEKGTKLSRDINNGKLALPTLDETALMYEGAVNALESCGYERYEVSNFAKQSSLSQSQHNQAYWRGSQYIGVGPGAHSRFFPVGEDHREARVQALDPRLWQDLVERHGNATQKRQKQSCVEILTELVSTAMRTKIGLEEERWSIFEPKVTLRALFENAPLLQPLFSNDFLLLDASALRATPKGLNVVDSIIPQILSEIYKKYEMQQI